jgi:precorrin-6Y C5,15-methyltransferase (decarboxylating)
MSSANPARIHIAGLGVAEQAALSDEAKRALASVTCVIGSERQLATIEPWVQPNHTLLVLPKLSQLHQVIEDLLEQDQSVMVLASGDPLFYGIGRWFSQRYDATELVFYPAVSSLQVACHRLGVSLQDVEVLSLHGRPAAKMLTRLRQHQPLLILTDQHSTPSALAKICIDAGFDEAQLTVLEALGYPEESIRRFRAEALIDSDTDTHTAEFHPLHVTLLEPGTNHGYLPAFPGIPDSHFVTDSDTPGKGMITKREVRLAILSLMQLQPKDHVWDIGAGCGGVAIEMAYWQPQASIEAIEHHPERLRCLNANRLRFGVVSNLTVIEGRALESISDLTVPNKVFIGGSGGELPALLSSVWSLLPQGGVLVVSAVTENTKQTVFEFWQTRKQKGDAQQETLQVAISRGETLAGQLSYRPNLPVTLYAFTKTDHHTPTQESPCH